MRVVYMGTPDFAVPCLDKLVSEGYEVAAVVTQPDRPKGRGQKLAASPVKEAALRYGLPVLQPEKIKNPEFIAELAELKPDVMVVVAFGQFLPQSLLEMPKFGCINVHASLLPYYRGAAPIHWAIINGETRTGVTTMYMDRGMDTGDMIIKAELAIGPNETTGELHDRLMVLGAETLAQTLALVAEGKAPRTPQDHQMATYASLLTRDTERIDWEKPAQAVHNLIRGLTPWPGAFCYHNEKILKVWSSEYLPEAKGGRPGEILEVSPQGPVVAAGTGALRLREVQPENRRRMDAGEYVRGYDLEVGETLR